MSDAKPAPIVRTSNLWLAAYWYGAGLRLLEASAVENPGRVAFSFADPEGRERELTTQLYADETLMRTLRARSDLSHALWLARTSPDRRCSGEDLRGGKLESQKSRRGVGA